MGEIMAAWASSKLKGIEKGDKNRVRLKSNSSDKGDSSI